MNNTLDDLTNHLFAEIERLGDESLTGDKLEAELRRAKAIKEVGTAIIDNARLQLDAMKHTAEYSHIYENGNVRKQIPEIMQHKNSRGGRKP